jgi:VIT1/CCC1 family predicted Fe2+/Mn2+ transporter
MRWLVKGAYVETGAEVSMTIEAGTEKAAELAARCKGIGVQEILRDEPGDRAPEISPAPPPPARAPMLYENLPPAYPGLGSARIILAILSGIAYVTGAITLVLGLASLGQNNSVSETSPASIILAGGAIFMSGGILHAVSAICSAVRDIARNSFLPR